MSTKDHFLPQFYLRNFEDQRSKGKSKINPFVWIYEKSKPQQYKRAVSNLAYIREYDTLPHIDGGEHREYDELLNRIDDGAAKGIRKLAHIDFDLSQEEITYLCQFLGVLTTRLPLYRNNLNDALGLCKRKLIDYICEISIELEIPDFGLTAAQSLPMAFRDIVFINKDTMAACEIFSKMIWSYYIASDDMEFLTSDVPIVTSSQSKPSELCFGNYGLDDAIVTFPISPKLCLILTQTGNAAVYKVREDIVTCINLRTIAFAELIISSREIPKAHMVDLGIRTVDGELIWSAEPQNKLLEWANDLTIEGNSDNIHDDS